MPQWSVNKLSIHDFSIFNKLALIAKKGFKKMQCGILI